jgi:hypothetical protein
MSRKAETQDLAAMLADLDRETCERCHGSGLVTIHFPGNEGVPERDADDQPCPNCTVTVVSAASDPRGPWRVITYVAGDGVQVVTLECGHHPRFNQTRHLRVGQYMPCHDCALEMAKSVSA